MSSSKPFKTETGWAVKTPSGETWEYMTEAAAQDFANSLAAEEPLTLADMIRPAPGKIAVLVESKSERTPSGLLIPLDTARSIHEEKATQGTVIAKGDEDDEDEESFVKLGDVVLFGKYTGTKIKYRPERPANEPQADQETVIIMTEASVLAVLLTPEQAANFKVRG